MLIMTWMICEVRMAQWFFSMPFTSMESGLTRGQKPCMWIGFFSPYLTAWAFLTGVFFCLKLEVLHCQSWCDVSVRKFFHLNPEIKWLLQPFRWIIPHPALTPDKHVGWFIAQNFCWTRNIGITIWKQMPKLKWVMPKRNQCVSVM